MRQKFPAPIYRVAESSPEAGFTFVEVLVSLLILGFFAVAVGQALFLSLRAERYSDAARASAVHLQTMAVAHWQERLDDFTESVAPWSLQSESIEVDVEEQSIAASLHRLRHPQDGPPVELMLWNR